MKAAATPADRRTAPLPVRCPMPALRTGRRRKRRLRRLQRPQRYPAS